MRPELLAVEPVTERAGVWRYGRVARRDDPIVEHGLLRFDEGTRCVEPLEPDSPYGSGDFPTAALLVRLLPEPRRYVYDLSIDYSMPLLPPRSEAPARLPRATAGRSKGGGPTLAERAQHRDHP